MFGCLKLYAPISVKLDMMIGSSELSSLITDVLTLTFIQSQDLQEIQKFCAYAFAKFSVKPDIIWYAIEVLGSVESHS